MKARRERPSQRLHHRVTAPLRLDIQGRSYRSRDWSLGGFAVDRYEGGAAPGERITCGLELPFQGFGLSFTIEAEVVRVEDGGGMAAKFLEMGDREREILSHFIDELVRGSMTSVEDTILRIDTPVTPVPTLPDPNAGREIPVRRLPLRTLAFTSLYLMAGLAVLIYCGLVAYANFLRLEIDTAVVSAPVQPILATADGKLWTVAYDDDQLVRRQSPLMTIQDAGLETAIEEARINVDRMTMELVAKERELAAERARLRDYRSIAVNRLARLGARVQSLEQRELVLRRQRERFAHLLQNGWSTRSRLDEVDDAYHSVLGQLSEARLLQEEQQDALQSLSEGRFFTGEKLEGRLQEVQAEVDLYWERVRLANDELLALERQKERLTIFAPTEGRLVRMLKPPGSTVRRGEEIALFERDEARVIDAFLTQEEVLEVGLGDEALIYFPALDARARAVVVEVDRTGEYLNEMRAQYEWRAVDARTARVTLAFVRLSAEDIRRRFRAGTPAVVIFDRRNTDELQARIADRALGRIEARPTSPVPIPTAPPESGI